MDQIYLVNRVNPVISSTDLLPASVSHQVCDVSFSITTISRQQILSSRAGRHNLAISRRSAKSKRF